MSEDATQLLDLQEIVIASDDESRDAKKILIIPVSDDDGRVRSSKGDMFCTAEDAAAVIRDFNSLGVDLPIDYEHQSEPGFRRPDGRAPAAGWISKLVYEAGKGLYGFVKWTETARQYIRDGEYRYLSPVAAIMKTTRHVVRLVNAGLCNDPAIVGMPAVTAKREEENDMPDKEKAKEKVDTTEKVVHQDEGVAGGGVSPDQLLGELRAVLAAQGVEVGMEQPAIIQAAIEFIKAVKEESPPEEGEGGEAPVEAASIRKHLGLGDKATTEEVINTLKAKDAHIGFTPNEEVKEMKESLEVLKKESAEAKGAQLREQYKTKLNPNDKDQMEWAMKASVEDPELFVRMVKNAPDALPPQGQTGDVPLKTDRETVIASARAEWKASPELQQLNSDVNTAVYGELRDKGLLTEDEKKAGKVIVNAG